MKAISHYATKEAVLGQRGKVELLSEKWDDFGGLPKEIFTLFFTKMCNTSFVGENDGVLHPPVHRMCTESDKFRIIGRILAPSASIAGYIPLYLTKSTLLVLGSG